MEVVNHNPTFGSSLLNDNFGLRDDLEDDLDPLQLEPPPSTTTAPAPATTTITTTATTTEGSRVQDSTKNRSAEELLENPNGATQMFTDMHGIPEALEEGEPLYRSGGRSGMRQMAHVTAGEQQGSGVTDWGDGTDAGRSGKPRGGVPYGSFAGV